MTKKDVKKLDKIVKQLVQFFDEGSPILIIGVQNDELGTIGNVVTEQRSEFLRNTADYIGSTGMPHGRN